MSNTVELSIVHDLFKTMNLLAGVDSDKIAVSWLEKHGKAFCGYVSGCWLQKETDEKSDNNHHKICDIFSGKHLCDVYVPADNKLLPYAAQNSTAAFNTWSSMTKASRSQILYNIAQTIEKYQQLFVIVEAVSTGKHVSKVKTKDVPDLIQSFNYYACCAAQLEKDWISTGPVCVVAEEYNNPCVTFSLRVSSILASGSSVLLLADVKSCLSSFLLAEICSESGLPDGVLNVIPIDQEKLISIGDSPIFSKLIFTGSLERSTTYSKLCAGTHTSCDILIPKRPVVIVYEKAHLHSAADGVLEAFFSHDTRTKSGGCKVMVQESISEQFLKILNEKFFHILTGQNTSKTDMSCIVTEEQKKILSECLEEAEKFKQKIMNTSDIDVKSWKYAYMMPTIISNLPANFKLVHEELGGPIIVVVPFRTIKESISMFNCDNKGSAVSIWTNHVSVAMEVALKLKTGVVWVNSQNVNGANIPHCGVYSSGNSVEGGKEALFHHMSVTTETERLDSSACNIKPFYKMWSNSQSCSEKSKSSLVGINGNVMLPNIIFILTLLVVPVFVFGIKLLLKYMRCIFVYRNEGVYMSLNTDGFPKESVKYFSRKEYKLFIGGIFKCSDNGTIKYEDNIFIPSGNHSDVHNAVSSAVTAQSKWESFTDFQKRKIFFAIIDKLKKSRKEYIDELHKVTKSSVDECEKEFDAALDLVFNLATQDDKFCGPVQEVKKNIVVLQTRYPLGVIGIQCSANKPLLSFITLIFSAIHYGNAVVAISNMIPTIALKMCEIFSSANVPSGVINIICGNEQNVIPALCKNSDINAIWFTDVPQKLIYDNINPGQRIFCCNKIWNDFNKAKNLKCAVECTFIKSIFVPAGEIFAN